MFEKRILFVILIAAALHGCNYTPSTEFQEATAAPLIQEANEPAFVPEPVPPIAAPPVTRSANQVPHILSSFSTEFKNAKKSRAHNIQKATEAINQSVVMPGDTFSFNETVGPTTKRRGYKLGRIFKNKKNSLGYGGGVCQVSGTLFNAVEQAGLEVVERHQHSKPVGYVPEGRDAATSYGVIDFKFRNNLQAPVKIVGFTKDEAVTINIEEMRL